MPKPRTKLLPPPREEEKRLPPVTTSQNGTSAPKTKQERQPRPTRRQVARSKPTFPTLRLPRRRRDSRRSVHAEVIVPDETFVVDDFPPAGNGIPATPVLPDEQTPKPRRTKQKRSKKRLSWRVVYKQVRERLRKQPREKKEKKHKPVKQTKRGRAVRWTLILLFFVVLYAAISSRIALNKGAAETHARVNGDSNIEAQLKLLGTSSDFPLQNAQATANRMAYECFTVPNYGADPQNGDMVGSQYKALANAAIPASDKINCGWNGNGRGKVDDIQVVNDHYWVQANRATIILQIKMYQRPGFFFYYVPFVKVNQGEAKISGMPAIFGTASGAQDFMSTCPDPTDTTNTDSLQHTAQLFLRGLAGDSSIDLGYLTYPGSKFGGFGPAVSSPKITQLKYCGSVGKEKRFAALVQFNGPAEGSRYTLPYGFGVVPSPETSGNYQVKEFGPAPGYTGE
jgi:hypothetical protein